jgi:hypothetical protein
LPFVLLSAFSAAQAHYGYACACAYAYAYAYALNALVAWSVWPPHESLSIFDNSYVKCGCHALQARSSITKCFRKISKNDLPNARLFAVLAVELRVPSPKC